MPTRSQAKDVHECEEWLAALRKVAKADAPEKVAKRTEVTAERRSASCGQNLRILYVSTSLRSLCQACCEHAWD